MNVLQASRRGFGHYIGQEQVISVAWQDSSSLRSLFLMLQSLYVTALDSCSFNICIFAQTFSCPQSFIIKKDIIFKWHMKAWGVICNRPAIDSRKERNSFQHSTDTNHKKIGCPVAHIHVPLTLCYKGAGCVGLTGHSFLLHQDPSKHLLYIHGTCRYSMGQRVIK